MQNSDSICVDVKNVAYSWLTKEIYKPVLVQIPRGKITAIMGPSGTGKTTLLRMIGGQLTSSAGNITFNGIDEHGISKKQLLEIGKQMGLLFQHAALFSNLSVFENVAFPYREHLNISEALKLNN